MREREESHDLEAVESPGVVRIQAIVFVGLEKRVVDDRQRFVRARIFANIFVANQYILSGATVFNFAAELGREIDRFVFWVPLYCCRPGLGHAPVTGAAKSILGYRFVR